MRISSGKLNAIKIVDKTVFNENYILYDIIVCIKTVFDGCNFKDLYFAGKNVTFVNCTFENCTINIKNICVR